MTLEEAKKILESYKPQCFAGGNPEIAQAIDTLLAAVQVTDEMVERAYTEWFRGHFGHTPAIHTPDSYRNNIKAALTTALGGDL